MLKRKLLQYREALNKRPLLLVCSTYIVFSIFLTFVLKMPFMLNSGAELSLLDSFFTSVSALTTTGLSTVDVGEVFNYAGWLAIIVTFNIGGVGIIVTNTTILLLLGRKIGISNRLLSKLDLNRLDMRDIATITRRIIFTFWSLELIGAILVYIQLGSSGLEGIDRFMNAWFMSASAVSGSGFYNTVPYVTNYSLQWTLILLMVFSFIGYPVILDLQEKYVSWRRGGYYRLSTFSRISIKVNGFTLLAFMLIFIYLERDGAMLGMSIFQQLEYATFMSVSTKSVGLSMFGDFTAFKPLTLIFYTIFMIIGGAPSSACGGVKVVSIYVIYKHIASLIKRNGEVIFYNFQLGQDTILKSYALVVSFVGLSAFSTLFVLAMQPDLNLLYVWFDVVSGYTTTGFSTGVLGEFNSIAILLVAILMLVGRIGIINLFGASSEIGGETRVKRIEKELAI
ncbi:potassium transporter TrkG [Mollicutes bacterium LVI A0039]|nr:potassium transporter TrkG [Mollicutes bacterium LVI A0039]